VFLKKISARPARKPNSVTRAGYPKPRSTIIHLGCMLPYTSSNLPGNIGRTALKRFPIWSCTGRGLPSFSSHLENWCALTAPFHPCLCAKMAPSAVYSLLHFPSRYRDSTLWSVLSCGVRTFLPVITHPAIVCSGQTEIFYSSYRPADTGIKWSCQLFSK